MTTENMRLVGMEITGSTRKMIFQHDTGYPRATRSTFAVEIPTPAFMPLKVGDVLPISQVASLVESVGGGVLTSGITAYTFKPGGVADPTNRIYTSWAALLTPHNADTGERIIYLDNSAGSITIPTGAQNFGGRTRLLPAPGMTLPVPVTLASGASIVAASVISTSLTFQA